MIPNAVVLHYSAWYLFFTEQTLLLNKQNISIFLLFFEETLLWTIVWIFKKFEIVKDYKMFFWDLVKKSRRRSRRVKAVKRLNSNVIAAREFIDIFRDQESPRSAIINHHHYSVYTLMGLQEYHMACVLLVNIDYRRSPHFVIFSTKWLSWNAGIMNSGDCF